MGEVLQTLALVIGAVGGLEFIKWWYNRKSRSELEALQTDKEEFHFLRERIEYLNKEMEGKEKRFEEQTLHIRELNRQMLEMEIDLGNKKAEISRLKAERAMKLCEVRGCDKRQPQSGY